MKSVLMFALILSGLGNVGAESKVNYDEMISRISHSAKINMSSKKYMDIARKVETAARDNAQLILDLDSAKDINGDNKASTPKGILYVFISKSVPLSTLRTYSRTLEKYKNAAMILNGFIETSSKIKPTIRFTANILKKRRGCEGNKCKMRSTPVDINPILFKKYGIKRVPAIMYVSKKQDAFCEDDLKKVDSEVVIYGDTDIYYALEQINKIKPNHEIDSMLKKINKI